MVRWPDLAAAMAAASPMPDDVPVISTTGWVM
jgi:hypothetical protein